MPPKRPPIISLANTTVYRHHPNAHTSHPNPAFFAGLNLQLPSHPKEPQTWCIVGPSLSGKTTLLQTLRGKHICLPPDSRTYPYLSDHTKQHLRDPHRAIRYVGFDAESGGNGGLGAATSAYLSARYESRRESTDFSLRDFLLGNTQLNPLHSEDLGIPDGLFYRVVEDLRLMPLLHLPVAFLSNGQGRRARIARALLTSPEVLLLDEPFMGLDPPTVLSLSPLLGKMAAEQQPRMVLSARPQDPLPEWVTHLVFLRGDGTVGALGGREKVMERLREYVTGVKRGDAKEEEAMPVHALGEMGRTLTEGGIKGEAFAGSETVQVPNMDNVTPETPSTQPTSTATTAEPLIEMSGVRIAYGQKVALGNWPSGLHWIVRPSQRWGVFGPNGSGKTTVVSLLCSDHPQAYSQPIKLFGRSRLPDPASPLPPLTFWDIQARIGHSSPEVHQHMPRSLTARQVVESAWAETFRSRPEMPAGAKETVDACLRWFEAELNPTFATSSAPSETTDWASNYLFGELSFSAQRVLLFLRALIKHPPVVVLDESFSGMDEAVRDKCSSFLEHGTNGVASGSVALDGLREDQALVCIAHVREEVPDCVREWICLPEANTGEPARFGRLSRPLRVDRKGWEEIWDVKVL